MQKIKDLKQALATLQELVKSGNLGSDTVVRDAAIQRFEYSFELCWKSCKEWLRAVPGVEVASPKECFRELRRLALISETEAEHCLEMVDDRNKTVHTYDEAFIKSLAMKLSTYYEEMKKLGEIVSR